MRLPRTDELEHVDIGVFGAPLDGTSLRGGTRHGPAAVRDASRSIRRVNPHTKVSPFDLANVADLGDTRVNYFDLSESLTAVQEFVERLRRHGVAPVAVGGDHGVTLPVVRGLFGGEPFGVLQFDSHADVQDSFMGSRDNQATLMR